MLIVTSVTLIVADATCVLSNEYRAVMMVVPGATAVTNPVCETVATEGCSEPHCTWACSDVGAFVVSWDFPPTTNWIWLGEITNGVVLLLAFPGGLLVLPPSPAILGDVDSPQAASITAVTETTKNEVRIPCP